MLEDRRAKAASLFSREIAPLIIPKEKVVVMEPAWSLQRALLVLTRRGTNSVPVINTLGQVEGLISKTDILDCILPSNGNLDFASLEKLTVEEAMNVNHFGILPNSIFSFAFESLIHRSYVPIIDVRTQFLGILTRKVMMEKVIEYFRAEYLFERDQKE
ncbi:CBS domain-containing protein [Pasteuria penetrans]|uniref:CBS domain-containing protein n=1 Tax=Pasteuria penetrans TaxID=86005 RepID=UPI0011EBF843|nr:CBS domain-containing protein [Pasteuria penetrans]